MTEIEKMFENAGVIKFDQCDYYKKYKLYCHQKDCSKCTLDVNYRHIYPYFTAEKQLKIIQLLSKIRGDIQLCYSDNQYIFVVNFETSKCQWANKYHEKPDEALADTVNVLWQSLTDQEKEEIRNILNE